MNDDGRKTLPVVLGGRSAAVIRLRGWERYAYLGFSIAAAATGGLALAKLLGASIDSGILYGAETITGAAALAAFAGFVLAMRRYDGETRQMPPSRMRRLASKFVKSE